MKTAVKTAALFLVGNLNALVCVIFAGVLAMRGVDGWGYFLFAAVLLSQSISSTYAAKATP